jgi:heavy metal efflux system protein
MLSRLIDLSVRARWLVALIALVLAGFGVRELTKLPIDAVPDITNRQVQVTTLTPALGPEEVERQVTFPLETALAGLPGLVETRSLSRHGRVHRRDRHLLRAQPRGRTAAIDARRAA